MMMFAAKTTVSELIALLIAFTFNEKPRAMLAKEVFARVFVSPLQRALETCKLASGRSGAAVADRF